MFWQNLRSVIYLNRTFYLTALVLWLIGFGYQLLYTQFELSVWVNNWNTEAGDYVMVWMTNAGDGLFLTLVGLTLILLKRKYWLPVLLCLTVPSLITQLLKHQVFDDFHRPVILMKGISGLHFVSGVDMNQFNSFPSGHTTAAFSLYTLLALMIPYKRWGWFWALVAAIIGISRVYLLQHFWMDILAGAMIGAITTTLLYSLTHPEPYAES